MGGQNETANSGLWGRGVRRQELTVAGLASRLEHRLHLPEFGEEHVRAGCAYAAEVGLPVVLCRPEHVGVAAQAAAGSGVEVATAIGFHDAQMRPSRTARSYAQEAIDYVRAGASQVGLTAVAGDASSQGLPGLLQRVDAVREAVTPSGARVRVLLCTTGMPTQDLRLACRELARAGVWMVQGGTFRGDRTRLADIVEMREALGSDALLKWTWPVRSLEGVLVCLAEGMDRFNGDVPALLKAAEVASRYSPVTIPLKGVDY